MVDLRTEAMFDEELDAFRELAATLTPAQWELPSLCTKWTVGDVVAHAALHTHRSGFRETKLPTAKVVERAIAREHAETREGMLAWLAKPAPADQRSQKGNVCESIIHGQDIRRVVGLARAFPEATIRMALGECATTMGTIFIVGRFRRTGKGLRLVATDIDWSVGDGPEVSGPAEALLMTIAARPAALADLSGPGVATMARRMTAVAPTAAPWPTTNVASSRSP